MLRIPIGLDTPLENQLQRGLEGKAGGRIGAHGFIGGIVRILSIHNLGHAMEGFADLIGGADAMVQPVGDVLA